MFATITTTASTARFVGDARFAQAEVGVAETEAGLASERGFAWGGYSPEFGDFMPVVMEVASG